MSVGHQELVTSSLRRPSELDNSNLITAALQLIERDERLAALLQPRNDPVLNGANGPLETGNQRDFMCPDLYRATVSGSMDCINNLLGFIDVVSPINSRRQGIYVIIILRKY
jgi:hypothetical protein